MASWCADRSKYRARRTRNGVEFVLGKFATREEAEAAEAEFDRNWPPQQDNTRYKRFVARYCDGKTPTKMQERVIRAFLRDESSQMLWLTGRGGGKSTCLEWLSKAVRDEEEQRLGRKLA